MQLVCKSKYCPSVAGPRTNSRKSHIGLRKIVYYLKCKVGRMPFCFSGPDLLYCLGYRNIHTGAITSEMGSLLFLGGHRSEKDHMYRHETNNTSFTVQKVIIITCCHFPAEVSSCEVFLFYN